MINALSAEDFVDAVATKKQLNGASHLLVQFDSIYKHNNRVESASMLVYSVQQLIRLQPQLSTLGKPWIVLHLYPHTRAAIVTVFPDPVLCWSRNVSTPAYNSISSINSISSKMPLP